MQSAKLAIIILLSLVGAAFGQAPHEDLSYPSPDKKWEVAAKWVVDHYDWAIRNNQTGKSYFGEKNSPNNPASSRYISAIWSPDSHYVAVNTPLGSGHGTRECVIFSIGKDEPKSLKAPWYDPSAIGHELLKDKDAKRFTGVYNRNWFDARKWINTTDLQIDCYLRALLPPSGEAPEEWVDVCSLVTFRLDAKNGLRIIRGKYESYEKKAAQ